MVRAMLWVLAILGIATAANATVSVVLKSDKLLYNPGDSITLTATVRADGGETSTQVYGEIQISGPGGLGGGSASQTALESFGGFIIWVVGTNPCNSTSCTMFNQIGSLQPIPVSNTVPPLDIAAATFTAVVPGLVNVDWNASTFDFFGIAAPTGTSFLITPEPTTATLLGFGLVGLSAIGRRRRR